MDVVARCFCLSALLACASCTDGPKADEQADQVYYRNNDPLFNAMVFPDANLTTGDRRYIAAFRKLNPDIRFVFWRRDKRDRWHGQLYVMFAQCQQGREVSCYDLNEAEKALTYGWKKDMIIQKRQYVASHFGNQCDPDKAIPLWCRMRRSDYYPSDLRFEDER